MNPGKSQYVFTFTKSPEEINNTVINFLKANNFEQKNEDGIIYYIHKDLMWGNRFFEYSINGNQITIFAYIGKYKKPILLDDDFVGIAAKQGYKNILLPLFNVIQNNTITNFENTNVQNDNINQNNSINQNNNTNQFAQDVEAKNSKMAIIGFCLSLLSMICACCGVNASVFLVFVEIYLASMGLKSSKKGLAIATFILAGLSFITCLAYIFIAIFTS